jgi:hypothetical protein
MGVFNLGSTERHCKIRFEGEGLVSCSEGVHSRWCGSLGVFLFCCPKLKRAECRSGEGVRCLVVVAGSQEVGVAYCHFEEEVAFVVIIWILEEEGPQAHHLHRQTISIEYLSHQYY